MRFFSITIFYLLQFYYYTHAQTPAANDVLQSVYARAARENKNVLVIFHASWCVWCRKMDSSLHDASVQSLTDKNYEITHLTVYESPDKKNLENPGALELLAKYGDDQKGLPYWFVFDKNGNLLADSQIRPGENVGC